MSLRGPPCAHGVAGTPQGEVRDRDAGLEGRSRWGSNFEAELMFDDLVLAGAASARRRHSCRPRPVLRTAGREGGAGGELLWQGAHGYNRTWPW